MRRGLTEEAPRAAVPPTHHRGRSLAASFRNAFHGAALAWRTQRTLRVQGGVAVAVAAVLIVVRPGVLPSALVVLAMVAVLAAELLNTAVEILVDRFVAEEHPAAKAAKDLAAAAVLITAVGAAAVGLLVLLPALRR